MHPPRASSLLRLVPFVVSALGLGCSSMGGLHRSAKEPEPRTIASIGDRPIAAVTGTPASSAVADLDPPQPRRDQRTSVSGRVVDNNGYPIAGAKVRLADGGLAAGRLLGATTDKTGAFTLRGLRPGSSYTLIAEYEGQGGLVTGRSEVRASDTDVEIAVLSDDPPDDRRRAGRSPSSRPVSDRRVHDEPEAEHDVAPRRINKEDIPPPREPEAVSDASTARRDTETIPASGWRAGKARTASSARDDGSTRRDSQPAPPTDDERPPVAADDGENPLPPAIESEGSKPGADPPPDETARRPRPSKRVTQRMQPKSPGPPPGALALAKDAPPVVEGPPPMDSPASPAALAEVPTPARPATPIPPAVTRPTTASTIVNSTLPRRDPTPEPAPFADPFAPPPTTAGTTWATLGDAWASLPAPDQERPQLTPRVVKRLGQPASTARDADEMEACRYDAKTRRIVEFRVPDTAGKPVSFSDLDADLVLIDFWGTWCRPCLDSIPHLIELQSRIGARKLAVVGIACEEGPTSKSAAHVAEVAKSLGINYTVLVSTRDGASPLQGALSIQAYPTMVLVNREGRVVWRDTGATPMTLARLDRVLDTTARTATADRSRR